MNSKIKLTPNFGHPADERPGFDLIEIESYIEQEFWELVDKLNKDYWHTWIAGKQGDHYAAALYQPCGIREEWIDEPKHPFDATKEYQK
jgi:hypothetical protein